MLNYIHNQWGFLLAEFSHIIPWVTDEWSHSGKWTVVVVVAFIYFLCGSFSVFGLKVSLRPLIGHNAYFELKALYITCNICFFLVSSLSLSLWQSRCSNQDKFNIELLTAIKHLKSLDPWFLTRPLGTFPKDPKEVPAKLLGNLPSLSLLHRGTKVSNHWYAPRQNQHIHRYAMHDGKILYPGARIHLSCEIHWFYSRGSYPKYLSTLQQYYQWWSSYSRKPLLYIKGFHTFPSVIYIALENKKCHW